MTQPSLQINIRPPSTSVQAPTITLPPSLSTIRPPSTSIQAPTITLPSGVLIPPTIPSSNIRPPSTSVQAPTIKLSSGLSSVLPSGTSVAPSLSTIGPTSNVQLPNIILPPSTTSFPPVSQTVTSGQSLPRLTRPIASTVPVIQQPTQVNKPLLIVKGLNQSIPQPISSPIAISQTVSGVNLPTIGAISPTTLQPTIPDINRVNPPILTPELANTISLPQFSTIVPSVTPSQKFSAPTGVSQTTSFMSQQSIQREPIDPSKLTMQKGGYLLDDLKRLAKAYELKVPASSKKQVFLDALRAHLGMNPI
jgi:hypothetical protein